MLAWGLNLLLPGCGLILRRRDWLGFALVMLYAVCGNIALAGWLIAPDEIRPGFRALAASMCVFTWLLAQWLLRRQTVYLTMVDHRVAALLQEARRALEAADEAATRRALEHAMSLDLERVDLHVLWARLAERQGDGAASHRAWEQVLRLNPRSEYRTEALRALGRPEPSRHDQA